MKEYLKEGSIPGMVVLREPLKKNIMEVLLPTLKEVTATIWVLQAI
jgi:hypothetical protein